jgi:hypothetical protein
VTDHSFSMIGEAEKIPSKKPSDVASRPKLPLLWHPEVSVESLAAMGRIRSNTCQSAGSVPEPGSSVTILASNESLKEEAPAVPQEAHTGRSIENAQASSTECHTHICKTQGPRVARHLFALGALSVHLWSMDRTYTTMMSKRFGQSQRLYRRST